MKTLLERARIFAEKAHEGQVRKVSGKPYFRHPTLVAKILLDAGMPAPLVAAAFNHDVAEDTKYTIDDIRRELGDEVAHFVAFNTEDKTKSWEERKTHTIEELKTGNVYEKALVVADKFANLLELIENDKIIGSDRLWASFKRGKEQQHWYFSGVAQSALENLNPEEIPPFFLEYKKRVDSFFA